MSQGIRAAFANRAAGWRAFVAERFGDVPRAERLLYVAAFIGTGLALQLTAEYTRVARFATVWQVFSIYGGVLLPLAIMMRGRPWHFQYAYSLAVIAPLDLVGFALGTSRFYPGNPIEQLFGRQSFTLGFVLLAGWMPLVGNILIPRIAARLGLGGESAVRRERLAAGAIETVETQ
jgi:hypothetical protein